MSGEDLDEKVNNSDAGGDSTPLNSLGAKIKAVAMLGLAPLALLEQWPGSKKEEKSHGDDAEEGDDEGVLRRILSKYLPGGYPSAQEIQEYAAGVRESASHGPGSRKVYDVIPIGYGKTIKVPSWPPTLEEEIRVFGALPPDINTGKIIGPGKEVLGGYLLSQVDYFPVLLEQYGEKAGISQDPSGRCRLRQPEELGVYVPGVFISKDKALKILLQEFNKSNPYSKI